MAQPVARKKHEKSLSWLDFGHLFTWLFKAFQGQMDEAIDALRRFQEQHAPRLLRQLADAMPLDAFAEKQMRSA